MTDLSETATPPQPQYGRLRGVVFDMDGTLTLPGDLDLAGVRTRHGIAPHADIMATIHARLASADPAERARGTAAFADVERVEAAGVAHMALQPGAAALLAALHDNCGLPLALVTRNTRTAVDALLARLDLTADPLFDIVITRDDLPGVPHKPAPDPLLHIARAWGVHPHELAMVGDFVHDIQCGTAAGARTVLLRNATNAATAPLATLAVSSLLDILPAVHKWMAPAKNSI